MMEVRPKKRFSLSKDLQHVKFIENNTIILIIYIKKNKINKKNKYNSDWSYIVFLTCCALLLLVGLTLLVPYLLTRRKCWRSCKIRVFIVGDEQNMDEGRNE